MFMMHKFMNTAEFVAHAYLSECWTCEIGLMCFLHLKINALCTAQDDDEVFVTGSTLYAGEGSQPHWS